jgi:hypothetical protein
MAEIGAVSDPLATAGSPKAPAEVERQIAAAVLAAAQVLRKPRAVLADEIARRGVAATINDLDWEEYESELVSGYDASAGALFASSANAQHPTLAALGAATVLPSASAWVHQRVSMLSMGSRMGLLAVGAALIASKADPWAAAGRLDRVSGLDRQRAVSVDRMVANAAAGAKPAMVERTADRVAQRHLRARAEVVGDTEARAALISGAVTAWSNSLPEGRYALTWVGGTCPAVCAPLNGTTVPLEENFPVGCPAHPRCGCSIELVMAATAGQEDQQAA